MGNKQSNYALRQKAYKESVSKYNETMNKKYGGTGIINDIKRVFDENK